MNRPNEFTRFAVMIILCGAMLIGITVGAIPIYNMEMTECPSCSEETIYKFRTIYWMYLLLGFMTPVITWGFLVMRWNHKDIMELINAEIPKQGSVE